MGSLQAHTDVIYSFILRDCTYYYFIMLKVLLNNISALPRRSEMDHTTHWQTKRY